MPRKVNKYSILELSTNNLCNLFFVFIPTRQNWWAWNIERASVRSNSVRIPFKKKSTSRKGQRFHTTEKSDVKVRLEYGKRLYVHMFDMVDTAFGFEEHLSSANFFRNLQGKTKVVCMQSEICRYCVFTFVGQHWLTT